MQINKVKSLIEQNRSGAGEYAVVEGLHAIKHALRFNAQPFVVVTKDKTKLLKLAEKLCPDIIPELRQLVEEVGDQFDKLSDSLIRTEVLALFKKPTAPSEESPIKDLKILLDDPRDLDNIGAVIRVCAAAGIKDLVLSGDSNPWNSRAIRAAAGLQFALNIKQLNHNQTIKLKLPIICFDERGQVLDAKLKTELPKNAIYVFGSERDGISKELKEASELIVSLPMQKGVSSMNLATSVAAALYSLK